MTRILLLATILLLAGCTTPPAPVIETHDVKVAVAQPCTVDTKNKRPELLTREQVWAKLAAASDLDTRAKIVTDQLLAYMSWLPVAEAAMQGCESKPTAH